jgi:hypothetical protein
MHGWQRIRGRTPPALVGEISRADLVAHCQSTLPIGATLSFEDTADLSSFSPLGQLAVFCD